ncbi:PREDICTED: PYK10-binding protein 2 isoform X2 [Tarenaya hassleriana]|uniref:PYK10-binding protein 2 isoform X2 n=1 Tax=Tarenaya hassleriana TaxID=28532 RepID=UPI00053C1958|nr:PREDICTED: PYK10-binding protein 2 isoform X2 [Tarenaya hassleriana]
MTTPFMIELNADEYLTEVDIYESTYSASFTFKSNQRSFGPYGTTYPNYHHREIKSPEGSHIVGFHGKSNDYLDRLYVHFGPINSSGIVKLEAQGRKEGLRWDDGENHDGIKNIMVGVGHKGVHYVKFDYDKSGLLNDAPVHGVRDQTFSLPPFEIDRPDEYLVSAVGYHEDGIIQGLQFKTNKRESHIFGYSDGTKFTLEVKDKKIVGFHGYVGIALNSIGACFVPISSSSSSLLNKSGTQGGKGGKQWDDGADHNGVTKIVAGVGRKGVHYVKFEYDKNGQLEEGPIRGLPTGTLPQPYTFDIDHPNEYLISVVGYYEGDNVIGLRFRTNERESQVIGYSDEGTNFILEGKNKKIAGFHGFADTTLNSLGAYFVPILSSLPSSTDKLEAQGGKGGEEWDDFADHDGIRNVAVGLGRKGVHYIKFGYDKSGQLKDGPIHGLTNGTLSPPPTFEIDHPNEYLISFVGYYNDNIIQGLQFKTNKRESQVFGYGKGTKFTLEVKDKKKIVGFHGYAETCLNSLGAYLAPVSSPPRSSVDKSEAHGAKEEIIFDDGVINVEIKP